MAKSNSKERKEESKALPVSTSKKTATQLRNARKRRSKQKTKPQQSPTTTSGQASDPSVQYLHNPKLAPLVQTAKQFFADIYAVQFPIYQKGPKTGWRTVSKLPVRTQQGKVSIGMFQKQSHRINTPSGSSCSFYAYPAHHPSINQALVSVAQLCQELNIDVYNEHDGSGFLRYVAMNVEQATGKVQLTLIWKDSPYQQELEIGKKKKKKKKRKKNDNTPSKTSSSEGKIQLERLISHLLHKMAPSQEEKDKSSSWQLHSLWVHFNAAWKHSNAIFDIHSTSPDAWLHVYGPKTIPEHLTLSSSTLTVAKKPTLHFGPNVFRQANLGAFAHIVDAIRQRIGQERNNEMQCVELYGGVGTIGLNLLDLPNIKSLVCSDENTHNQDCFAKGLASLESSSAKATYVPLNATDMVKDSRRFLQDMCHVLIVDPPRKGLDEPVVEALISSSHKIQLLVYVSCGFEAFQRDYKSLTDKEQWKLEHAEGHILFPGSNAIETLAFFTHKSSKKR
ncbi:Uncharacterized RNA methyltransferase pc1998 [Seminavis robusta]|uniref:Uncharacterized RNA methyltransferase pc1998 n=1 Tax=Seminavis robusta TaxID=568900 RepID=A0A9N8E327_9STRA|nr:Uncharacterized RNA methyltransferase pc1998 [Seminavis robusta]|eukprot:Sro601_g173620.1 Uncharacterized RNA methyltransferase pc1998 (506) ;mRNA; f:49211-50728